MNDDSAKNELKNVRELFNQLSSNGSLENKCEIDPQRLNGVYLVGQPL